MELERNKPITERVVEISDSGPTQLTVDTLQENNSKEAHTKLMRTAYKLALNTTMPLSHFKTLVKVQRISGIRLIDG